MSETTKSPVTAIYDKETNTFTVSHLPRHHISQILTQAALHNYDGLATQRLDEAFNPGRQNDDEQNYNEESLEIIDYLDKVLNSAARGTRMPKEPAVFNKADMDKYVQDSLEYMRKERVELEANQDKPLPDFPRINVIASARSHFRRGVRLAGHASEVITGLLNNNPAHQVDSAIKWLRQAAAYFTETANELEKLRQIPPAEYEITVKDVHPTYWEKHH